MPVTIPNTFFTGEIVDAAELNQNFSVLAGKFNAGINSSDIDPGAGILSTQIANAYSHYDVVLRYGTGSAVPAAWPGANTRVDMASIPGVTGDVEWTVTRASWLCTDTGDGLGSFNLVWGEFTAGGVWSTITTLLAAPQVMANAAAAQDSNDGFCTLAAVGTLAFGAGPRHLALVSTAAGVGLLTAATDFIRVTCRIRRTLAA